MIRCIAALMALCFVRAVDEIAAAIKDNTSKPKPSYKFGLAAHHNDAGHGMDVLQDDWIAHIVHHAESGLSLPNAVTLSIVLCVPLAPKTEWRDVLRAYMYKVRQLHLQYHARAYEIVFAAAGADESIRVESAAYVKALCRTCILHFTNDSVDMASVNAIARHGAGKLTDEEALQHVILYVGHLLAGATHRHLRQPSAPVLDLGANLEKVASGWTETLDNFNDNANVQTAACGFDDAGRPKLNVWWVRASHVRRLMHPSVYFADSSSHGLCQKECVNNWMITWDKQHANTSPESLMNLCGQADTKINVMYSTL